MIFSQAIRIALSLALIFSSQCIGIQYAYSVAVSVPGNVVVRTSQNSEYLNGSLTVSWDAVSGATAYAVIATRSGTSTYASVSVSGEKNTQAVISGLVGGVTYIVQVRAIQDVDASAWSANTLTAIPKTVPKAVGKPSVVAGVGSATVTWVALVGNEDGGSSITSYVVREINSGNSMSVAATESTAKFTNLEQGSAAAFKINAISDLSPTGSLSVASDEVTILSAENVSPEASASPSASAQPSSPVEVSIAPSSSGGGSSGGGGGSSGGGGGSSGGVVVISPGGEQTVIPTPPSTLSPSATPTPTPSTFIPAEKTPLKPVLSPSPKPVSSPVTKPSPKNSSNPTSTSSNSPTSTKKPSTSSTPTPVKSYLEISTSKSNVTTVTAPVKNASLVVRVDKNLAITLPGVKAGSKIVTKVRTPSGSILALATITAKKTGAVQLPALDFKKTGVYEVITSINGKVTTLKITVKK